jgi:membrane protein YdbS with pleckstrin-like domain
MSETNPIILEADIVAPPAPALPEDVDRWQPLPDDAAQVAMISGLLWGLMFGIVLGILVAVPVRVAWPVFSLPGWLGVVAMVVIGAIAMGVWLGYRRWKHTAWKLDETGLHVRRGRTWRKEILVPRSRVQHLDIERGPIERHFGLATLIVHTAGTRLHAIRQPGFHDADAVALRDALVPASARNDDVL